MRLQYCLTGLTVSSFLLKLPWKTHSHLSSNATSIFRIHLNFQDSPIVCRRANIMKVTKYFWRRTHPWRCVMLHVKKSLNVNTSLMILRKERVMGEAGNLVIVVHPLWTSIRCPNFAVGFFLDYKYKVRYTGLLKIRVPKALMVQTNEKMKLIWNPNYSKVQVCI